MAQDEKRKMHPRADEAATWLRGRLVGAVRAQGGSQAAMGVLRQASDRFGPRATDDALAIIKGSGRSTGKRGFSG